MFWRQVNIISEQQPFPSNAQSLGLNHDRQLMSSLPAAVPKSSSRKNSSSSCESSIFDLDRDILTQLDAWVEDLQTKMHEVNEQQCESSDEDEPRRPIMDDIHRLLCHIEDTKQFLFSECILRYEGDASLCVRERQKTLENVYARIEMLEENLCNFRIKHRNLDILIAKKKDYLNKNKKQDLESHSDSSCEDDLHAPSSRLVYDAGVSAPSIEDMEREFKKTMEECGVVSSPPTSQKNSEPEEENMHVILHELISTLGQCNKPIDHDILDQIWHQMPEIEGVSYPTRSDYIDSFQRQSQMLCLMTQLYEKVSRHAMDTHTDINAIYADPACLRKLMAAVPQAPPNAKAAVLQDESSDDDMRAEPRQVQCLMPSDFLLHK